MQEMGLSNDEAKYLKEVQSEHDFDATVQNVKDWYSILKASHNTYSKVKSILQDVSGDSTTEENVNTMLKSSSYCQ